VQKSQQESDTIMVKPVHIFAGAVALALVGLGLLSLHRGEKSGGSKLNRRMISKPGAHMKHHEKGRHNEHRDHASFDPEVAQHSGDMDGVYGSQEDHMMEDDDWWDHHYHDREDFNISERIQVLFPSIDADGNGSVTYTEMENWHYKVGLNASMQRANREFGTTDADGDGKITLAEYLGNDFKFVGEYKLDTADPIKNDDKEHEDHYSIDWVRSTVNSFKLADKDGDGLDKSEFHLFLHPEESADEKLHKYLIDESIRERDTNDDGKLSAEEFHDGLWHEFRSWEDDDMDPEWDHHDYDDEYRYHMDPELEEQNKQRSREKFDELDKNADGHIDAQELMPELRTLHPGEAEFAKRQAVYMIEQADDDKDGSLSLEEMLANPYVFYSAAMGEDDSYDHDEFK